MLCQQEGTQELDANAELNIDVSRVILAFLEGLFGKKIFKFSLSLLFSNVLFFSLQKPLKKLEFRHFY